MLRCKVVLAAVFVCKLLQGCNKAEQREILVVSRGYSLCYNRVCGAVVKTLLLVVATASATAAFAEQRKEHCLWRGYSLYAAMFAEQCTCVG